MTDVSAQDYRDARDETSAQGMSDDDAVDNEVRRQQQMLFVRLMPLMAAINAANGLMLIALFWTLRPTALVMGWYGLILLACAMQMLTWLRLRNRPTPHRVSGRMLNKAQRHSLAIGLVWGAIAYVFYPPDSTPYQMFVALVVGGMAAGTTSILSPIPKLSIAFLAGVIGPLTVRCVMDASMLHLSVIGFAIALAIAMVLSSLRSFRQLQDLVRFSQLQRETRADLLDAVESSNDGFALLDAYGGVLVANARFRLLFDAPAELLDDPPEGKLRHIPGQGWVYSTLRPTSRGGFVSMHVDVTELKRREQELIDARTAAETADRAKTQFLKSMSHELRTPLNAVIGFSQIMVDKLYGELGDPRYAEHADDIQQSGKRLLTIINDILDLAKIESGSYETREEELDIEELIEWAAACCARGDASRPPRHIKVEYVDELPELVWLDQRAVRQILTNIIGNAAKFTPPDRGVGVRVRRDKDAALIEVWDEGIGIPADKIDLLCRPFVQVDAVLTRSHQGTGLGLAIAFSLTRLLGGALTIDSVEGRGTTVAIRLPLSQEPHLAEPPARPDAGLGACAQG